MKRLLLGLLVGAGLSCGAPVRDLDRRDRGVHDVGSISVTVTQGDRGTPSMPLPFTDTMSTFSVHVEVRDNANAVLTNFNEFLNLSVTPGVLRSITNPDHPENVLGRNIRMLNGVADVQVSFSRAYGEVRIWVEDAGYVPLGPDATTSQCTDGIDNDMDGRSDFPSDYGCAAPNDDSEAGGSYALGATEPFYFLSPTINGVQGAGTMTNLLNERVTVNRGTLIVTRIDISGFWVSDIADRSCPDPTNPGMMRSCYHSIFVFNFRLPEGLRPCDRLSVLQGTVAEFVSTTQFAQPAWTIDPAGGLFIPSPPDAGTANVCPIPPAVEIVPANLATPDTSLEPLESALVRVTDITLSQDIGPAHAACDSSSGTTLCTFGAGQSNCDLNDSGTVDFSNPQEAACANTCQRTRGCSEWTNWLRFGQLAVDFVTGQMSGIPRLVIAPRNAISNFDPLRQPVTGDQVVAITGTLKQVGPTWIVEPRCTQDLVLDGSPPLPTNESCLSPRTVTEEP